MDDLQAQRAFEMLNLMEICPDEFGDHPDEVLYNCLIDMCVRYKDLDAAIGVFHSMKVRPSAVTYGILIKAYGKSNLLDDAFHVF